MQKAVREAAAVQQRPDVVGNEHADVFARMGAGLATTPAIATAQAAVKESWTVTQQVASFVADVMTAEGDRPLDVQKLREPSHPQV